MVLIHTRWEGIFLSSLIQMQVSSGKTLTDITGNIVLYQLSEYPLV
jgi:hypothetical protein